MIVLAFETSCDDTCASVVTSERNILSNVIYGQIEHQNYGGIVPEYASRAHLSKLPYVMQTALKEAQCKLRDITHVAVTTSPGLIGSLLTGMMFARGVSDALNRPYLEVNHLVGHALTPRLEFSVQFPYLLALLSGGHCQLLLVHSPHKMTLLGQTRDDALGEVFDKIARMLGFEYPGGRYIEEQALGGDPRRFSLPMPLCNHKEYANSCDFSFSGLKTAVSRLIEKEKSQNGNISSDFAMDLCASFQYTVTQILESKLQNALNKIAGMNCVINSLAIAGGVASNEHIRNRIIEFGQKNQLSLLIPSKKLCTDNAAMIGWAAIEQHSDIKN